ncbi:hypothetical protein C8J56DRAFT_884275 [Mycena floridula]|nr:hypothetical protein C8J56DRAFT_884275 [Mycena floridula]
MWMGSMGNSKTQESWGGRLANNPSLTFASTWHPFSWSLQISIYSATTFYGVDVHIYHESLLVYLIYRQQIAAIFSTISFAISNNIIDQDILITILPSFSSSRSLARSSFARAHRLYHLHPNNADYQINPLARRLSICSIPKNLNKTETSVSSNTGGASRLANDNQTKGEGADTEVNEPRPSPQHRVGPDPSEYCRSLPSSPARRVERLPRGFETPNAPQHPVPQHERVALLDGEGHGFGAAGLGG